MEKQIRLTAKTCCVCGDGTKGAQHWNRDTGYGICPKCIAWLRSKGTSEAELLDLYGVEGVNYLSTAAGKADDEAEARGIDEVADATHAGPAGGFKEPETPAAEPIKINVLGVEYAATRGTNFGPRISPEDAAAILRHANSIGKSHQVAIYCKEYGQPDEEADSDDVEDGTAVDPEAWAEVYYEDWHDGSDQHEAENGEWPDHCKTFEVETGAEEIKPVGREGNEWAAHFRRFPNGDLCALYANMMTEAREPEMRRCVYLVAADGLAADLVDADPDFIFNTSAPVDRAEDVGRIGAACAHFGFYFLPLNLPEVMK